MDDDRKSKFWGLPTLGGSLVILNCLLWVPIALISVDGPRNVHIVRILVGLLALILSLPMGLICFCLGGGEPDAVTICIAIGINSFIWGYGISFFYSVSKRNRPSLQDRRRDSFQCIQCGYSLTGNVSGICPECGTKTL